MTNSFKNFLAKKNIEISAKRYFIDAMSAMAMGLFSSLLVGTILNSIGLKLNIPFLTQTVWPICRDMTGAAIGIAIAHSLKAHTFVLFSATIVGFAGNKLGGPVGAFIATIISTELGKAVSRETKIDLIVTPMVTIISGAVIASAVGPGMSSFMTWLGKIIMEATTLQPFWMGVTVSVLVGVVLTLPISSAAICMMLSLGGLAGGAATAGCAAQMIGFAAMSYRDNGLGGSFAVGIGTSMLHMPNIIKNPKIWIPPTLAAAILGPLATIVFKMENIPLGSGMGTCGLVGQIGTITAMEAIGRGGLDTYAAILLLHFIMPAALTLFFTFLLRKINWIKDGDLKLNL
ncbi:PTS sugar transporter subunit IIC [Treponema sp. OMZ 787]|uniref:PTS transporter subunit IIC n=1 Tax=Treponema sp. OMZ 787 TaxID=2563669 RepID=UPI0020A38034|nr:PTS sugar transporter subunit IIC [Treponema sp. OMZ 787]UTC62889.1 PTS sugar transporter subunit IIC [Treponema sp. OMZ 787]